MIVEMDCYICDAPAVALVDDLSTEEYDNFDEDDWQMICCDCQLERDGE